MADLQFRAFKDRLDKIESKIRALDTRAPTGLFRPYTPVLTASSVDPNLGASGTALGRWTRLGDLVYCGGALTFGGAGVAAGTGSYRISLPVPQSTTMGADWGTLFTLGSCRLFDTSGVVVGHFAAPVLIAASKVEFRYQATYPTGADTVVGAAAPWVWATGDSIGYEVIYEAAP